MITDTKKGYILVFLSVLFSVSMFLVSDFLLRNFPTVTPQNAAFWGDIGAVLFSAPYFLRSKNSINKLKNTIKNDGKLLFWCSSLTSFGAFLWWYTLDLTDSSTVAMFGKSEILFAFFLGIIFLQEKINKLEIISIIIVLFGFYIFSQNDEKTTFWIITMILLSRFLYTLQSFLIKRFGRQMHGFSFGFLRMILMGIFLGIGFGVQNKITFISFNVFALASFGIILNALFSKVCYFEAHKFLPISKLNFILILKPIFVLLGAYILFHDTISQNKSLGAIIILSGILFFMREQVKLKQTIKIKNELSKTN